MKVDKSDEINRFLRGNVIECKEIWWAVIKMIVTLKYEFRLKRVRVWRVDFNF